MTTVKRTPTQFVLEQNKRIFDYVTKELDLEELEYAPNWVQGKLNELDESKRNLIRAQIDTIRYNNMKAIDIIGENIGAVRSKSLADEFKKYVEHALRFNDIWKEITSDEPPEPGRPPNANLLGPKYPKVFDKLLQDEIDKY